MGRCSLLGPGARQAIPTCSDQRTPGANWGFDPAHLEQLDGDSTPMIQDFSNSPSATFAPHQQQIDSAAHGQCRESLDSGHVVSDGRFSCSARQSVIDLI